jgi:glycosyltransferase involved in cell wall biosynthesis
MTIYFLQVNDGLAAGGLIQAYRHVRILADAGHDARVLFLDPNDKPAVAVPYAFLPTNPLKRKLGKLPMVGDRLHNRKMVAMPIIDSAAPGQPVNHVLLDGRVERRTLTLNDILVLPEFPGPLLRTTSASVPVVVLNQGPHLSFQDAPTIPAERTIYQDPILGVVNVSAYGERFLKYAYPSLHTYVVPNSVDLTLFKYEPEKKKQIAFMPRKLREDLLQVLTLLSARGALAGWQLCPIEGVYPPRAAELMRESAVFLSTLMQEGFGLPPLEAGLCGCVVVGYTGFAAAEFMDPQYCFPVPERDVLTFARTLEQVLRSLDADPTCYRARGEVFAAALRERYSPDEQKRALLAAWDDILGRHAQAQGA